MASITKGIVVKEWTGRRIVLPNGSQVAVGIVRDDYGNEYTGVRFEMAGVETVRFGLSAEAVTALTSLLTDQSAGEMWDMPSDVSKMLTFEWRLARDEDIAAWQAENADKVE